MRILIVRPQLEWGGAAISILRLADVLRQMDHEVHLASCGGELLQAATENGLPVHQVPLTPSSPIVLLRAVFSLRKIVLETRVDVVHSHHRFSNLACRLVSVWTGVPLVTTVHEYKHNLRSLTRLGLPGPVVTFSHNLRQHLAGHYRVPAEEIAVVEMGIRESQAPPLRKAPLPGPVRIGCFSRLVEEKGVDVLLRAAAEPPLKGRDNVEFLVVGDGPLRAKLELQASSNVNGIPFHFLGWVESIETILPDVNFLVLPSRTEGFGMVILEALRYRKPSVASRVGSIPELIEDGRTGLLVPPDDPAKLAEAIATLLDDDARVRAMGETGYTRIANRFSVQAMGEQMLQIYKQAVEGRRS